MDLFINQLKTDSGQGLVKKILYRNMSPKGETSYSFISFFYKQCTRVFLFENELNCDIN